ncbi:MAG: hypothetical protein ACE5E5_07740 [Phycisphaerae bacterium]
MPGETIKIIKSPWYTQEANSPEVRSPAFGLKIAFTPAAHDDHFTVALLGAYRLQGRFSDMYGSRIPGATHLVARNTDTGLVFFGNAEDPHAVPIATVVNPDPKPANDGEPKLVAVDGFFNIDLAGQLGLPPEKASYLVFGWLDEVTTNLATVEMPEDKIRHKMSGPGVGQVREPIVDFGRVDDSPKPGRQPITLRFVPGGAEVGAGLVHGAVAPAMLPKQLPEKDEPPTYVTVMAFGQRTRELRWHSIELPDSAIEKKQCFFRCPLEPLTTPAEQPQRVFVLCMVGTERSEVLRIEAPKP